MYIGAIVGALVGFIDYLTKLDNQNDKELDFLELILWVVSCGLVGSLSARLPDILEPATNPNHRKFFHSILLLLTSGTGTLTLTNSLIKAFCAGYVSHLIADLTTPKGLPLI